MEPGVQVSIVGEPVELINGESHDFSRDIPVGSGNMAGR